MDCPHCGAETTVDPALIPIDAPMIYCTECGKGLFETPKHYDGDDDKFEVDEDIILGK